MNTADFVSSGSWRIVWTIAAKDIIDVLKNRSTLGAVVVVVFLVFGYKWMPNLYERKHLDLVVYDAGKSQLSIKLEDDPWFRVWQASSMQVFREMMDDGDSGALGLIIPDDFDRALESSEPAVADGYVLWAHRQDTVELTQSLERQLEPIVDHPIDINVKGSIYPAPDSMGSTRMVAVTMVVAVFFMGTLTVPHMMFEEKQTRTLDSLLISPATPRQIVLGKALAGLFYCLIAVIIVLAINGTYVVQWGLAILVALLGSLFAAGTGLLLGIFLDNKQQLSSWVMILGHLLLLPVFLSAIEPILPVAIRNILPWMPMVAQALLFRYACSSGASMAQIAMGMSITMVSVILVLAMVIWKVRQMDH